MSRKLYISSDYIFNRPEKKDTFEAFGEEVVPVDFNWAFVPEKKNGEDNLKNAQETIRSRFSLGK
jgi:hypothetical protein